MASTKFGFKFYSTTEDAPYWLAPLDTSAVFRDFNPQGSNLDEYKAR